MADKQCTSRNPHGTHLRCRREVAHEIHANCSIWWDDLGGGGVWAAWPRESVPLFLPRPSDA